MANPYPLARVSPYEGRLEVQDYLGNSWTIPLRINNTIVNKGIWFADEVNPSVTLRVFGAYYLNTETFNVFFRDQSGWLLVFNVAAYNQNVVRIPVPASEADLLATLAALTPTETTAIGAGTNYTGATLIIAKTTVITNGAAGTGFILPGPVLNSIVGNADERFIVNKSTFDQVLYPPVVGLTQGTIDSNAPGTAITIPANGGSVHMITNDRITWFTSPS